jgi:cellulose biosynthesis protein BcsQ
MTVTIAIANRKGGVGKSTITTMLAHSLSVWGKFRVLVVDLDSQANSSLILMGGRNWAQARIEERTAADYLFEQFSSDRFDAEKYIFVNVGDVTSPETGVAEISLIPGSLEMENHERDLIHRLSGAHTDLARLSEMIKGRISKRLEHAGRNFDIVLIDCPPGISYATEAALQFADRVVVPFRPDYVSLFAVDRIARMIENADSPRALQEIPKPQRRYVALANLCQNKPAHKRLIDDISAFHPVLKTQIPQSAAVSNAFDWEREPKTIELKYGAAMPLVRNLYSELLPIIEQVKARKGAPEEWDRTKIYARPGA